MKINLRLAAIACAFMFATAPAQAGLIGANVTGTLAFGGSGQFWVPQNAVIGAGVEYFYTDGANDDTADFTDTLLTITDNVKSSAIDWEMTFQSTAFIGATLLEVSDNFVNGGVSFSILNDTLTFSWAGTSSPAFLTAVYSITTTAVPEPGMLAIFGLGLVGLGFARRKKQTA